MRKSKGFGTFIGFILAALWASPSLGQLVAVDGAWLTPQEAAALRESHRKASSAPAYGTLSTSIYSVGACDAGAQDDTHTYQAPNCAIVRPIASITKTNVGFPVHLPTGALITSVTMYYYDDTTGTDPFVGLWQISNTGDLTLVTSLAPGSFHGGNNSFTANLVTPFPVDNSAGSYVILATLNRSGDTTEGIYKFEINYKLQVSPAPATATFADVPTSSPQFKFVEALHAAGITAGCGGGNYCPNDPITRGQMAVFLSVALGLFWPN